MNKEQKKLYYKTCEAMKALHEEGKTDKEIEAIIKNIDDLPFGLILSVMAHFSEIIKYGRPLTKYEKSAGLR